MSDSAHPANLPAFGRFPVPLGAVILLSQVALGIVLFAVFQQFVPQDLDASDAWGGYLLSAYGAARFLSETPTGAISDRLDRKSSLLLGFVFVVPAIVVMSFLEVAWGILLCSALLGVGSAFLWPATYAFSADLYPPERRGKVVGFLNVFQLAGFGIGALAGAFVVESSPEAMFAIASIAALCAAVAALVGIPHYRTAASLARERHRRPPLRKAWSARLGLMCMLIFVATAGVAMIVPAIRPYGDEHLGVSFAKLTTVLIPGVVLGAALYVPAGHIADRYGRTIPVVVGQLLLVVGMLTVAQTDSLAVAAFGGAVIFAGNVFSVPALNSAIMDLAPETHRGTLIGLAVAVSGLGLATGPAIGGAISVTLGPEAVFRAGAVVAAVTGAAVFGYGRRAASREEHPELTHGVQG